MANPIRSEESVFLQAIEIADREAREKFLDDVGRSDPEMRNRVAQLVQMHFSEGRILDETCDGALDTADLSGVPEIGSMTGPYKLLQEIGEGGMGIVFMAEQTEPVRRKVAVKIIKVGMDTQSVVARFESERQAMALMEHPCITKVFDAGATPSGRPYFVMELVRGQTITEYCDQKKLSLQQRLQIFMQVCNALEHAHQKGIIHRDIKPTNIMVTNHDGQPLPKIIDFGIAKATKDRLTEKTVFTTYGEMVGTPLYMSPEQAEMSEPDVDTRSDIYSLGVLLYELLTGTTPFHDLQKQSFHDIREAIRSRDPQLASTRINNLGETVKEVSANRDTDVRSLHRFVRGELDWILMKCLARDRKQRYQSAGQLAQEIGRYLNGEAIEAAAPTIRYRTQKFVSKHRAAVAIAAGFAFILASGTVFSTWMAVKANTMAERATRAEKLANTRLDKVKHERDRAIAAEQRIAELERKQRYRAAMHQATSNHNANMVKRFMARPVPDPARVPGKPSFHVKPLNSVWTTTGPTQSPKMIRVGTKSSGDFNQMTLELSENEADDVEVVLVADDMGCRAEFLKSVLKQQQQAFGRKDVVVASTLHHLGEMMSHQENWDESEAYFREAFEILKENAGDHPQISALRLKLVRALKNKGDIKKALAELNECKELLKNVDVPRELSNLLEKVNSEMRNFEKDNE